MPRVPVPPEVEDFLRAANPAVIGTVLPSGSPHSAATWYEWADGEILVNMDRSRLRLANMRRDPRVSLTVLAADSWYRQVTLLGRVVRIADDPELADIDRLARRYTGNPHRNRGRDSVSAWIRPERWYGWEGGALWPRATD